MGFEAASRVVKVSSSNFSDGSVEEEAEQEEVEDKEEEVKITETSASVLPEKWDVLGLGQAMVGLS